MPIPESWRERYAAESLYTPDAWFVHELLDVDPEARRLVARTDTTRLGMLVDAQRDWPGHEKHLPGAVAIQMTGTLGHMYVVFALGLLATEGWIGFGTHINAAKFVRMGRIGPPVEATVIATRSRKIRGTVFSDLSYTYTQEGEVIYTSSQTAAWYNAAQRAE